MLRDQLYERLIALSSDSDFFQRPQKGIKNNGTSDIELAKDKKWV